MNRRDLLTHSTALVVLAACARGGTLDPTQAIANAGIVVNGISGIYQQFAVLYPSAMSPAQQTLVTSDLAAAKTAMDKLSTAASSLTTAQTLQAIETNINVVLRVLSSTVPMVPGVPPAISAGIIAANVLLPMIEGVINQLQGAPPKLSASPYDMTPDKARLVLIGAAARK